MCLAMAVVGLLRASASGLLILGTCGGYARQTMATTARKKAGPAQELLSLLVVVLVLCVVVK